MEALIVTVVSWDVLVGARPVVDTLPPSGVGVLDHLGIVLAIGIVGRHGSAPNANLSWLVKLG